MTVLAVLAGMLLSSTTGAETIDELKKKQQQARAEKATVAAQIDVLKATEAEVSAALDALQENVSAQEAVVADALREVQTAEATLSVARAAEIQTQIEIDALRIEMQDVALDAFVNPATQDLFTVLDSSDPSEAVRRQTIVDMQTSRGADIEDSLAAKEEDLERWRHEAETASQLATLRKAEMQSQLIVLDQARAQQQAVVDQVEAELDKAQGQAAWLEKVDKQLSLDIIRKQAEYAAQIRRNRGTANTPIGPISLAVVGCGIVVNAQIAERVAEMLGEAAKAGINLCGGGYRDSQDQVRLRRAHCGSSDYDVYQKPSSQCRPPTARPGASMHERGLAIDFTCNGALITSRSNACYKFLAANAPSYGLYGNNVEAWHWSTNGN